MSSVNKVILLGRVGKDPETRYFPDGGAVCNLSLATSTKWKDKQSGESMEATEWHKITFTRGLAEIADKYVSKGKQIYVEGRLKTRKWKDKDGRDNYTTEVVAENLVLLGDGGSSKEQHKENPQRTQKASEPEKLAKSADGFDDMDDDSIPF